MRRAGPGLVLAALAAASMIAAGCDPALDATERTIGKPGFYRLAEQGGVWWFLDPGGERMVSIGINHIEPILLLSESNKDIFARKYGADLLGTTLEEVNNSNAAKQWAKDSRDLVQSWGFNTLGVHNPVPQRELPYVAIFRPAPIDGWAKLERRYPDPFDPRTESMLDKRARAWCARNADDPLILGVSFNDMPLWRVGAKETHPWVRTLMELPAGAPGKRRWLELLRERYPEPTAAAAVYGVDDASWEDLEARTAWPEPGRPWFVYRDAAAFLPLIADAWYGAEARAVRRCDPNHLIFGDKFEGTLDLPSWLYPIIGRHFDLAYIQWYARAARQENKLAEIHAATGEPVLMGDSSFSHPSANIPKPKGVHLAGPREVGEAYAEYLETMMTTPYVVGWHHCGFIEGSPDLARYHPYVAIQPGFLRPDGTPYEEMVAPAAAANRRAFDWHAGSGANAGRGSWAYRPGPAGDGRCAARNRPRFSLSQVDNNVFIVGRVAIRTGGVPNKNIGFVVTDEGLVAIDTGFVPSAVFARQVLRQLTDKPVRYIVYTHHHGTQVAGAGVLREKGTQIVAHEQTVREFDLAKDLYRYNRRRDGIQFNLPALPDAPPPEPIYPDITFADTTEFTLGGTRFQLFHAEGEAAGYALVFMPEQKVLWVGDMAGAGMPLLGSPMKRARDEVKWKDALELMKRLDPDVLIASVGPPICDRRMIRAVLDTRIEYLRFLHDAVVREMNAGSSLEQTLADTALPPHLAENPLLREEYGNHVFNVRALYHRYSGWFDQDGTHLDPAPAAERARRFVADMGGRKTVLDRAFALADGDEPQPALEYVDLLIEAGGNAAAHRLKSDLLLRLGKAHASHRMTASMYGKLAAIEYQRAEAVAAERNDPR
ncbi:MAG TPA: alkyl sulfatase dimerization domain-containing protein [Polyangia bacterium]|nr:alkyl sulfatase dimerization domain-containing protein [Polyangia bacterium]